MLSPCVGVHTLKGHQKAADITSNSTVCPRLVPRDGVQGPRQGSTRKIPNIYRWAHGIREECHEGQFAMFTRIGLSLRSSCDYQSGEGFSQSITSDCLSRLEDDEQTGFSEEVVRDVSGNLYGGEHFSRPCIRTRVPHSRYSWSSNSMLEMRPGPDHSPDTGFRRDRSYRRFS